MSRRQVVARAESSEIALKTWLPVIRAVSRPEPSASVSAALPVSNSDPPAQPVATQINGLSRFKNHICELRRPFSDGLAKPDT